MEIKDLKLYREYLNNGAESCKECIWFNPDSIEICCNNPLIYTENMELILEMKVLIKDCIDKPNKCILFQRNMELNFK